MSQKTVAKLIPVETLNSCQLDFGPHSDRDPIFRAHSAILNSKRLLLIAAVACASISSVQAFDYITYTSTLTNPGATPEQPDPLTGATGLTPFVASDIPTPWGPLNHSIPQYNGDPSLLVEIQIRWDYKQHSFFGYDNDDTSVPPATGFNIIWSVTDSLQITMPGEASPTLTASLAHNDTTHLDSDDGDPTHDATGRDFRDTDGFFRNFVDIGSKNYATSLGATLDLYKGAGNMTFPASSSSSSSTIGSLVAQTTRINTTGSTITLTYVLVPESNPLVAVLPALVMGAGLVAWRRRKAK